MTAQSLDELDPLENDGYSYRRSESNYGSVKQRWLVIHSEQAEKRVTNTVKCGVEKELEKIQKQAKKLQRKEFYCEPDAHSSLLSIQKEAHFHTITVDKIIFKEKYKGRGRPSKSKPKEKKVTYFPHFQITRNKEAVDLEIKKRAIFIVATNELSYKKLTDQEVFDNYKGQKMVERGFRFLKDPLFFASSLFLKKPERIVALTMIMCLSLLVYSICERNLRNTLKKVGGTICNQVGKPARKPTLRWVFQLFEDVHFVKITDKDGVRFEVKNLRAGGVVALKILGGNYMDFYLVE